MNKLARVIAFYLPQFHPTPLNDKYWGKGFTEWTNVGKAKPLFPGHNQPKVPADLGYYDLRLPEVREQQANLAKEAGVEAFAYWHYWFGNGERVLEKIFESVVNSGKPDFPFCLAWANETWTGRWHGLDNKIIAEQKYPGLQDIKDHFYEMLPAFKDDRYLKSNGRNVFIIYRHKRLPDTSLFTETWQNLAKKENIPHFYFVAVSNQPTNSYFDGFVSNAPNTLISRINKKSIFEKIIGKKAHKAFKFPYRRLVDYMIEQPLRTREFPVVLPNWDNTPRSGKRGLVITDSTPSEFKRWLDYAIDQVSVYDEEERFIFLKSWNEWAEGNYVEPDLEYGHEYLRVLKESLYK